MNIVKKYLLSIEALVLIGFLVLYVYTAPFTVQSGDTGELVTNSYFLRVSHPPGYPLWTLLYHLPLSSDFFSTPFYAAGVLTAFISVLWLGLLLFKYRNNASLGLVTVLGSSVLFWRYSVLPDVFSLHMLFIVLVFLVFMEPKLLEKPWMIFLVSLSITNHHTIVFLFPMYLFAVIQGNAKKKILYSLGFGILSFSTYFLLTMFHPNDYGSWDNITSFKKVVDHFLRKTYGTFSLSAQQNGDDPVWLGMWGMNLLTNSWSMLIAFGYVLICCLGKIKHHYKEFGIITLCLLAYLMTFILGGVISLNGFGETVFERFLLQPSLLLFFIVLMAINLANIQLPRILVLMFLVNAGLNITQNFSQNNYRKNTMIEDFSLNILNSLPTKSIFYSFGDTQGSAAYYLYEIMKVRQDVVLLHPTFSFKWSRDKAKLINPQAFIPNTEEIIESINFKDYDFFINFPVTDIPFYHQLSFYGLVFKITKSEVEKPDIKYDCNIPYHWRQRSDEADFLNFEVSRIYDLEYGRCDYSQGLQLLKDGKIKESVEYFEKGVELSRFSAKFLERLCHVYKLLGDNRLQACNERLEELIMTSNRQYYLYEYEK